MPAKIKVCKNCKKEYTGQNKVFCSGKCRTEYLRNTRKCVVCGKEFWASPSSEVLTCSVECEKKNRTIIGKSEENIKVLEIAREACAKSPNCGDRETNATAKSWGLVSPDGTLYEINNLSKWCRDHADIIPYSDPRTFCCELYKIKQGNVSTAGGWTLKWWNEKNKAREGMPEPKRHPKRTKMSEEERLQRKRERAKEYYRSKRGKE